MIEGCLASFLLLHTIMRLLGYATVYTGLTQLFWLKVQWTCSITLCLPCTVNSPISDTVGDLIYCLT